MSVTIVVVAPSSMTFTLVAEIVSLALAWPMLNCSDNVCAAVLSTVLDPFHDWVVLAPAAPFTVDHRESTIWLLVVPDELEKVRLSYHTPCLVEVFIAALALEKTV